MKKRIMIIDDDPQIREIYQVALEMQDYEIIVEPDGKKALDVLVKDKKKPDLVLLDIMMPKIHGLDVLNMIKTNPATANIKVIMLSAISDETAKKKAAEYGAYSYLVKSEFSMAEIIKKVSDAINS
jgi:DNA-binding response OmpR family regulator